MLQRVRIRGLTLSLGLVSCLALLALQVPARAETDERTSVTVLVKDAATDQPLPNARLTLMFKEPRKLKRDKGLSYSAKTNPQGRYKFRIAIARNAYENSHALSLSYRHEGAHQFIQSIEINVISQEQASAPRPCCSHWIQCVSHSRNHKFLSARGFKDVSTSADQVIE